MDSDAAPTTPDVEPMPSIFGPDADASSSEGGDDDAAEATMSDSEEVAFEGRTRSMKASRLKESEADSEERACPPWSPHPVDTEAATAA